MHMNGIDKRKPMNTVLDPERARNQRKEPGIETSDVSRPLPDPAVCRVKRLSLELVECRTARPTGCPHVVAFGNGFFCWHPQRLDMASHPRIADEPPKGMGL